MKDLSFDLPNNSNASEVRFGKKGKGSVANSHCHAGHM